MSPDELKGAQELEDVAAARSTLDADRQRRQLLAAAEFKAFLEALQTKYGVTARPMVTKVELSPNVWVDKAQWEIV